MSVRVWFNRFVFPFYDWEFRVVVFFLSVFGNAVLRFTLLKKEFAFSGGIKSRCCCKRFVSQRWGFLVLTSVAGEFFCLLGSFVFVSFAVNGDFSSA